MPTLPALFALALAAAALPVLSSCEQSASADGESVRREAPADAEARLRKVQDETRQAIDGATRLRAEQEAEQRRQQELAQAERAAAEAALARELEPEIEAIAREVTLDVDEHKQTSWLEGPIAGLGSLRRDNETGRTYLYAYDHGYHESAADESGRRFPVIEVNRPWDGYSCVELADSYLREHAYGGVSIKFWGGRNDVTIALPPAYVLGFLRAAERNAVAPR